MNPWTRHLKEALHEDGYPFDWTSRATAFGKTGARAALMAKSQGVWAGDGLFDAAMVVSHEINQPIQIKTRLRNGDSFSPKDQVAEWKGSPTGILVLERAVINLASYACGIATATRYLVQLVEKKKLKKSPRITLTRKTLPGYRDLAIESVIAGGGHPHRVSLAGGVLVKENHLGVLGGIRAAVEKSRHSAPHGLKIEVEVKNLKELKQAIEAGAEAVLLDNFEPVQVAQALQYVRGCAHPPVVEVSGGLSEHNILDYAMDGVDILSVGGLTHSVRSVDLSLLIRK